MGLGQSFTSLTSLDLRGNPGLGAAGGQRLAEAVEVHPHVRLFYIDQTMQCNDTFCRRHSSGRVCSVINDHCFVALCAC